MYHNAVQNLRHYSCRNRVLAGQKTTPSRIHSREGNGWREVPENLSMEDLPERPMRAKAWRLSDERTIVPLSIPGTPESAGIFLWLATGRSKYEIHAA